MSEPVRVIFMGTPDFALPTLRALSDDPGFDVVHVVTQPDKPKGRGRKMGESAVKKFAGERGISASQPRKAGDEDHVAALEILRPDLLVVVAYGQLLPPAILGLPKVAPVNLHASILPRWRGAAPIHRAFLEGDETTGVSAMIMGQGLDTGDVISVSRTRIRNEDTVGILHDRLAVMGAELITATLPDFINGKLKPIRQDHSKATYARKLDKYEFTIDWSMPAVKVDRVIRGLSPFPGAVTSINGDQIKPLFSKVAEGKTGHKPGVVLSVVHEGLEISCGRGSVFITHLKPAGGKAMSAHAFCMGRRVREGNTLG